MRELVVEPDRCGLGKGAACCAYLVFGQNFLCGRTMPGIAETIKTRLAAGTINAKYDPSDLPYPDCQPFERAGEGTGET